MGQQGQKGEPGLQGPQGPAGPKGDSGTYLGSFEASLGVYSFDTTMSQGAWTSALTLPIVVEEPAEVIAIATGNALLRPTVQFNFKAGLDTSVRDPSMSQTYSGVSSTWQTRIPLALTRTFTLEPGAHSIRLLLYNASGAPTLRDAVLTALVIRR